MYVYKSTAESSGITEQFSLAAQSRIVAGGREGPCFAVCALVCDFSPKAEGVPAFACESERGPFVGEVEKWDEKRFGTALWR